MFPETPGGLVSSLTPAGASVRGHDVAVFRAGTLVAAWDVHTFEGTQVASALRALVNICAEENTSKL